MKQTHVVQINESGQQVAYFWQNSTEVKKVAIWGRYCGEIILQGSLTFFISFKESSYFPLFLLSF